MTTTHNFDGIVELVITPSISLQLSDLTMRRFVALYPIGFEVIVGDDGRSQFRVWDEDGLAVRIDQALAYAGQQGLGTHWVVYDQRGGKASLVPVAQARRIIAQQAVIPPGPGSGELSGMAR